MNIAQRDAQVEFGVHKAMVSVNEVQYYNKVFTTQTCCRFRDYHSSDKFHFEYSECNFCGKLAEISVLAKKRQCHQSEGRLQLVKPAQDTMKGRHVHKERCTVSNKYVNTLRTLMCFVSTTKRM